MDLEKEFNEKFSKGVSEVFLNPYEVSFSKSKFIHEKWFSSGTITFDNEFSLFFEIAYDILFFKYRNIFKNDSTSLYFNSHKIEEPQLNFFKNLNDNLTDEFKSVNYFWINKVFCIEEFLNGKEIEFKIEINLDNLNKKPEFDYLLIYKSDDPAIEPLLIFSNNNFTSLSCNYGSNTILEYTNDVLELSERLKKLICKPFSLNPDIFTFTSIKSYQYLLDERKKHQSIKEIIEY